MAMNKDALGANISNALKAANPNSGGMSPAEAADMEAKWKIIADELIKYFKSNMDIKLLAGDIPINPGSFKDSLAAPVTGQGQNAAITVAGRIE